MASRTLAHDFRDVRSPEELFLLEELLPLGGLALALAEEVDGEGPARKPHGDLERIEWQYASKPRDSHEVEKVQHAAQPTALVHHCAECSESQQGAPEAIARTRRAEEALRRKLVECPGDAAANEH